MKAEIPNEDIILYILRNPNAAVTELAKEFNMFHANISVRLARLAQYKLVQLTIPAFIPGRTGRPFKCANIHPIVLPYLKDFITPTTDNSDREITAEIINKAICIVGKSTIPQRILDEATNPNGVTDPIQMKILTKLIGGPKLDIDIKRELKIDKAIADEKLNELEALGRIRILNVPTTKLKVILNYRTKFLIKEGK